MLKLYNTLTRKLEDFKPLEKDVVRMYTCGPTVYDFAHIGNLRTYIFEDILRRTLEYDGYKVDHAMNITDVGHLVGDGDDGEDKMEVGAKREGKSPLEIARQYEEKFFEDLKALNVELPTEKLRATDAIAEQIDIIKILQEKGFTYQDESAIYFDTSKLPDYGKLSGQKLSEKKTGARADVVVDTKKKNPQDFALWFFLTGRYQNHTLHWPSPWGEGFPGWHIECSAISRKLLGQPFDIHTGGVDHIGTHHSNEIAQSEAAFGIPLANLWMHGEFLLIDSGRMGKSEGNAYTLDLLTKKGFSPLDFRYLCLTAHYRTQLNFTWEGLEAAHTAKEKLYEHVYTLSTYDEGKVIDSYKKEFALAINDDLNTAKSLALVWRLIADNDQREADKYSTLLYFDTLLGLDLKNKPTENMVLFDTNRTGLQLYGRIAPEVMSLLEARESARKSKDFAKSDELRKQIEDLGYEVMDTDEGQKIRKK